jgi:hypothetical protein
MGEIVGFAGAETVAPVQDRFRNKPRPVKPAGIIRRFSRIRNFYPQLIGTNFKHICLLSWFCNSLFLCGFA